MVILCIDGHVCLQGVSGNNQQQRLTISIDQILFFVRFSIAALEISRFVI